MATELGRVWRGLLVPLGWLNRVWPNHWLQDIRIEDRVESGRYVVRAEIPGVNPDRDVRVTCAGGQLHLVVTRAEKAYTDAHSEFRYGRFVRTLPLPPDARGDTMTATYDQGILEITVSLRKASSVTRIPIDIHDKQDNLAAANGGRPCPESARPRGR